MLPPGGIGEVAIAKSIKRANNLLGFKKEIAPSEGGRLIRTPSMQGLMVGNGKPNSPNFQIGEINDATLVVRKMRGTNGRESPPLSQTVGSKGPQ